LPYGQAGKSPGEEAVMRGLVVRFFTDEIGATAIEYSLIAAGIAMAVIAAVNALGTAVNLDFEAVKNNLQ
jgi:pilus assembly protein Flp/PilA